MVWKIRAAQLIPLQENTVTRSERTMMSRATAGCGAVMALVLLVLSVAHAAPPSRILQAVALAVRLNPQTGRYLAVGTAFHVGGGLFRTAGHVAQSRVPPEEEGKGYEQWALFLADEFGSPRHLLGHAEVACADRRWAESRFGDVLPHDSGVFRLATGSIPAESLSAGRRPNVGDAISIWGFPGGKVLFEAKGRITRISDEWIRLREQLGFPSLGGHSGSPVLDATGTVVGILVAGVSGVGEVASAVPIWDAESACPSP